MGRLTNDGGLSWPVVAVMIALGGALVSGTWIVRDKICALQAAQAKMEGCGPTGETRVSEEMARSP